MKKREYLSKSILIYTLIIFCLLPLQAWSSDPVSVKEQVDVTHPTLGDILTYSLTVTHDPDIILKGPEYEIPEGTEKVDSGNSKPVKTGPQTSQEFWLKIRIDKTGPITFPSIPVWFDAPGQNNQVVQGKIMTSELIIEIQSLLELEGNASDIKDIKPIAEIKAPWMHYIWKSLGVLCILALAYFIWKNWQKKSNKKSDPIVLLTAEEKAMKELRELQERGWMKLGRIQDHFFELSEIFRRYLENRFKFPAQEWTTEEILHHLKSFSGLDDTQKRVARSILTDSDMVKFAKAQAIKDPIDPVIQFIKDATPAKGKPEAQVSAD
ncbi:MAG: hypothetical protein VW455_12325 [Nitrospinota bacterium]